MNMVATLTRPGLATLVDGVRRITAAGRSKRETAFAVADFLRAHLPGLDILTEQERAGKAETYHSFPLHAETGFSIVAVVWRPGQGTVIHDHLSWCAFGVLSGNEHETLYRDMGDHLVEIGRADNRPGEVSGFAPPGDIHSVINTNDEVGVSIHIYGADVSRTGSSVRRVYDLPVL
ncbi:cysteine dioxygenase family protein [Nonomuraea soli]|uniref:Putative metal-dependent enzyme (Double-stranded beta helix superfamily) n=1 Tax=Nonomuraea soli TaxID=1032476 RepID=A0A7W0HRL4_9ACTN|nr:cysteine dioxygenase family protein [Nonomuraea soli]MBA2892796.1 putative metal-dependent enzyme (double-stranded beta helix superfamily) [Nonomuraea soli]